MLISRNHIIVVVIGLLVVLLFVLYKKENADSVSPTTQAMQPPPPVDTGSMPGIQSMSNTQTGNIIVNTAVQQSSSPLQIISQTIGNTSEKCLAQEKKDRIKNYTDQINSMQLSDSIKQQIQKETAIYDIPQQILVAYYILTDPKTINILNSTLDNFELSQQEISCAKTSDAICKINRENTKIPLFIIKKINLGLENLRPVITKAKQVLNKNLNSNLKNCTTRESHDTIKEFISEYDKLLANLYRTIYL